jgi:DNA mismatch repair protein MutS
VTPVRRQYLKIKHSYPDTIVLFRLGDFYETFDDDAQLAARELEITLTSRTMGKDLRVPMAGVPAHALESYLARLIKKGHKVAICEQLSDPSVSRGLVERDVVRVVTPGTIVESGLLEQKSNNYLAAVIEEGDWAGLAYVDITTGEFATTQLPLERVSLELERLSPAEVLVPGVPASGIVGPVMVSAPSGDRHVTMLEPSSFGFEVCQEALLQQFQVRSLESFGCQELPLAVRAAGAIIGYLGRTHQTARPQLRLPNTYSTSAYMILDAPTRRNLELFQAGRGGNNQLSLLTTVDQTRTPMGGRLLRRWLGQPSLDLAELNRRLDAVEFFHQDAFRRRTALDTLARIADLERLCGRVQAGTVSPRELLALKSSVEASAALAELFKGSDSRSFAWLGQELVAIPQVVALIEDSVASDPSGSVGEGGVLRPGFSNELDRLKSASSEARGFIGGLERQERERTGIKNLKVGYNQVFGYYIEVSNANLAQVPPDYIRRQTLTNGQRYMVPALKEYEALVLTAGQQIEELEQDLYRRVCAQIAESAGAISRLAQGVAQVDAFAGLAEVAVSNRYVRPRIDLDNVISIKDGRHPVVERVLDTGTYVPNDVYLSNDDAQMIVLTGPNMAGKSTFIRQVAIITLMAQMGSFVPAAEATIGLVDRIFTRVGLQDDLTTGQSTFMVEMVETAAILNQATSRSLLILDEIGRGTSTYDGLAIARAVIEYVHNDARLRCKSLFATHYHELTELANILPGIRNFNVAVAEEGSDVVFLHRIVPGGADRSYGVHVARLAGLPPAVVRRAWEVLSGLEQPSLARRPAGKRGARPAPPGLQIPLFNAPLPLVEEVLGVDIANLTPLEAINKLYELQEHARILKDSG